MQRYDTVVIGGGAAGMFAAVIAARKGQRVLLLERNARPGKKLLITGKGRCNVTNNCTVDEVLKNVPRNARFLYSAMNACPPEKVMDFFATAGCPLKTERGNRVFPVSDKSADVLETLQREMRAAGVHLQSGRAVDIRTQDGRVRAVATQEATYGCQNVILATGGLSYPATGSTGDGYAMARALGHTIIAPQGSLVPLETAETDAAEMQGLSLRNVEVKLLDAKGKKLFCDFGELLFTHFGVSGPTILSASSHLKGENCRIVIDLKPALDEGKLDARILRDLEQYKNRSMENALVDLLPRSMIPVVLRRLDIDPTMQANALTRQQRHALVGLLKAFCLTVRAKRPVEEAIVTSGGVQVAQIDPKTMQSKLVRGLYFAGEIIDCDAYTGGFNLQIAWATAYAAATALETE